MEKILLITTLIFIVVSSVRSQEGKYCLDEEFTRICYDLNKEKKFRFKDITCTGIIEGKGRFKIDGIKIMFIYEPIAFFENQFEIEKLKDLKEKIEIKFEVNDYDTGKRIEHYKVGEEKRGQYAKEFKLVQDKIVMDYEGETRYINISSAEYSNYTFKIKESGSYKVALFLKFGIESGSYEMKEGIEEFTIIELTEDEILLKLEEEDNYVLKLIKKK